MDSITTGNIFFQGTSANGRFPHIQHLRGRSLRIDQGETQEQQCTSGIPPLPPWPSLLVENAEVVDPKLRAAVTDREVEQRLRAERGETRRGVLGGPGGGPGGGRGGCGWLWVAVGGCGWLWVAVGGCGWLWVAVGGCGDPFYSLLVKPTLDFFFCLFCWDCQGTSF